VGSYQCYGKMLENFGVMVSMVGILGPSSVDLFLINGIEEVSDELVSLLS